MTLTSESRTCGGLADWTGVHVPLPTEKRVLAYVYHPARCTPHIEASGQTSKLVLLTLDCCNAPWQTALKFSSQYVEWFISYYYYLLVSKY